MKKFLIAMKGQDRVGSYGIFICLISMFYSNNVARICCKNTLLFLTKILPSDRAIRDAYCGEHDQCVPRRLLPVDQPRAHALDPVVAFVRRQLGALGRAAYLRPCAKAKRQRKSRRHLPAARRLVGEHRRIRARSFSLDQRSGGSCPWRKSSASVASPGTGASWIRASDGCKALSGANGTYLSKPRHSGAA